MLVRLARIEALDRRGASPTEILTELRALLGEAEAWSRTEGGDAEKRAVAELRRALCAQDQDEPALVFDRASNP